MERSSWGLLYLIKRNAKDGKGSSELSLGMALSSAKEEVKQKECRELLALILS
jgi:hypothetical protein